MLLNASNQQYEIASSKPDYSYQADLIQRAYQTLIQKKKVLLAACPGAGKTVMAIQVAKRYRQEFPKANILILAHGQVILREQWSDQLKQRAPELNHLVLEYGNKELWYKKPKVIVGLPQGYRLLEKVVSKIDLLIVDEAHHYYMEEMLQNIVADLKPTHQMLLTGTPSEYVGDKKWNIIPVTILDLLDKGVLTDPHIELVESKYAIKVKDYNAELELKSTTELTSDATRSTLDLLLTKVIARLTSKKRETPEDYNWEQIAFDWSWCLSKLHKTMIVCFSQKQAQDVYAYFMNKNINCVLSISDVCEGQQELEYFKTDPSCLIFIVVNRGVLGFDYDELTNLIDLSGTINTNRLFQMLCRIVRKNHKAPNIKKLFIKMTPPRFALLTHYVMSFVVAMADERCYLHKKGDIHKLEIPWNEEAITLCRKSGGYNDDAPVQWPDLPEVNSFQKLREIKNGKDTQTLCYTSFKDVKNRLMNDYAKIYSYEDCISCMNQCQSRNEFIHSFNGQYNWMIRNGFKAQIDEKWLPKGKYTLEEALETMKKYDVKYKFREAHHGLFKWMIKNGHEDKFPWEAKRRWDFESAWKEAKKYKSARQFRMRASGAHDFLIQDGRKYELKDLYKKHNNRITWTKEKVVELSKQYYTLRGLRQDYPGAESHMRVNDYKDEVKKHLKRGIS